MLALLMGLNAVAQAAPASPTGEAAISFAVTFDAVKSAAPLDGRLLLLLSTDPAEEPRFQINDSLKTQIVFGMDVKEWKPGEARTVDAANAGVFGNPIRNVRDLKPGEYTMQALLDRYETFQRADGHMAKLPTDRGEGRKWNRAPGNTYSKPRKLLITNPELSSRSGRSRAAASNGIFGKRCSHRWARMAIPKESSTR